MTWKFLLGGGPAPKKEEDPLLLRVGAAASHMSTRVANALDSDGACAGMPVPSEAAKELLESMARPSSPGSSPDASPGIAALFHYHWSPGIDQNIYYSFQVSHTIHT